MALSPLPNGVDPCKECGKVHLSLSGHRGCRAHNRAGEPCKQQPKRGTPTCRYHGGNNEVTRVAASKRLAMAEAQMAMTQAVEKFGLPLDVTPEQALTDEVKRTAGNVAWLRDRVMELSNKDLVWGTVQEVQQGSGPNPGTDITEAAKMSVWYEMWMQERRHLVAVSAAALKAGIEERRVKLAEQQGNLVAQVISRILDDLSLSEQQRSLVGEVVPRQLRLLTDGKEVTA